MRGDEVARGRRWDSLVDALERTADRCASSPGLGMAAMEIRSMLSHLDGEAGEAARAALTPEARVLLDETNRRLERDVLEGTD